MITANDSFDVVVIGSGPAGQNAALEAASHGARTLIVERERRVGGACVQYGTIPSKTLRETAVTLTAFRRRSGGVYEIRHDSQLSVASLMTRLDQVVNAHQTAAERSLQISDVERAAGKASFVSPHEIRIRDTHARERIVTAQHIVVATGSRPRNPDNVDVDHENILDSDSILSMSYLPRSLVVLGSGVIACEYASTFASLGVRVIMIDKYPGPLGFLDSDLVDVFLQSFRASGGEFRGNCKVSSIDWDGVSAARVFFEDGEVLTADKALVAQGRIANLDSLRIENAGLAASDRGLLDVNEFCQTSVPHIYAVGDTIGPPALASASMEQGRRAMCHAFTGERHPSLGLIPAGIYTIPEMATVGLTEQQAIEKFGAAMVGKVDFDRLARAHIMASPGGLLKLVADGAGHKLLGVQVAGDAATELVHLGQMALMNDMTVDAFATTVFNFPTMAEAYRLAAVDIMHERQKKTAENSVQRPDVASRSTETV
ncbi:MAG: Si-specific NAD(P)(+) transhydrogenase [Fuerstiella sp.]